MLVKGTGEAAVGTGKSGLDAGDLPEARTATSSGCYREVKGDSSVKGVHVDAAKKVLRVLPQARPWTPCIHSMTFSSVHVENRVRTLSRSHC